ncbi:MAG: glycosyltransferase family 2 protein, partial [Anaerolineae bacterium]
MITIQHISLIIPTHNRKDTLRRCLATATSQDYPDYEVIVVDDG